MHQKSAKNLRIRKKNTTFALAFEKNADYGLPKHSVLVIKREGCAIQPLSRSRESHNRTPFLNGHCLLTGRPERGRRAGRPAVTATL